MKRRSFGKALLGLLGIAIGVKAAEIPILPVKHRTDGPLRFDPDRWAYSPSSPSDDINWSINAIRGRRYVTVEEINKIELLMDFGNPEVGCPLLCHQSTYHSTRRGSGCG